MLLSNVGQSFTAKDKAAIQLHVAKIQMVDVRCVRRCRRLQCWNVLELTCCQREQFVPRCMVEELVKQMVEPALLASALRALSAARIEISNTSSLHN